MIKARRRRLRQYPTLLSILTRVTIVWLCLLIFLLIWFFIFSEKTENSFEIVDCKSIPVYIRNIPENIIQTSKYSTDVDIPKNSFVRLNPSYKYFLYNDSAADDFVRETMPDYIYLTYTSLPKPILKSDYFRYIVLLVKGGIYTDTDTVCLRPIDTWMKKLTRDNKTGLIIGIEADIGLWDLWQGDYTREIQFVQWTIAAAAGHPILHEIVQRIANITPNMALKADSVERSLEWTGPGLWTDVITNYFWNKYQFRWKSLRNLKKPKLVGEDIYVLPITAFSPGLKRMGSNPINDSEANVQHFFSGSWRNLKRKRPIQRKRSYH